MRRIIRLKRDVKIAGRANTIPAGSRWVAEQRESGKWLTEVRGSLQKHVWFYSSEVDVGAESSHPLGPAQNNTR